MNASPPFSILPQPDETSCGPTCLHAVYRHFQKERPLGEILQEVPQLEDGGTLAVILACHALKQGFSATLYTYNLNIFDPTWFTETGVDLRQKLRDQDEAKKKKKLSWATEAYLQFLDLGGEIRFEPLKPALLRRYLDANIPMLTGLSATYLYQCAREDGRTGMPDDVRGLPSGHFVVVYGYDAKTHRLWVADPYIPNPFSEDQKYSVSFERLIASIFLGIVTYDANLLVLQPKSNTKSVLENKKR